MRHPARWLAAALAAAAVGSSAASEAQVPGCELHAEAAERVGEVHRLQGVRARCGEVELQGDVAHWDEDGLELSGGPATARLDDLLLRGAEIRWHAGSLTAREACLRLESGAGPTCCGATVAHLDGAWTFEQVTCESTDGARLSAAVARWEGGSIALIGSRSGDPLALPYPVAVLDARGRAPGLRAPSLGYSTERGLGVRANAFVPMGGGVDLDLGAFGESDAGAGVDLDLRWPAPGRAPSSLGGFVARDGTTDRAVRAELRADARLGDEAGLGLAAVGQLYSDNAVGRDYGRETTTRRRPDRHFATAAWAGGSADRLWLGAYQRQLGRVAAAPPETPVPDHLGHAPAAGWLAALQLAGVGQLSGGLRFDRAADSGSADPSNRLRLATGGELFAASSRFLTVTPGLWLDADVDFSNPEEREGYRRFDTRLLGTLTLSSPWVGGSRARHHLLEPRARVWWTLLEASEAEGELAGLETEPVGAAAWRTQVGLGQSLVVGRWTLSAPVDWMAEIDGGLIMSHVVLGLSLTHEGAAVWRLDHRLALDTDDGAAAVALAATSLHFGEAAEGLAAGRSAGARGDFAFGATYLHVEAQRALTAERLLPSSPLLRRGPSTRAAEVRDGAQLWSSAQLGPLGVAAAAVWPIRLDERPDLTGALWLGQVDALRALVSGGYLADDTGLVQLTLVLGSQWPPGPWSPSFEAFPALSSTSRN